MNRGFSIAMFNYQRIYLIKSPENLINHQQITIKSIKFANRKKSTKPKTTPGRFQGFHWQQLMQVELRSEKVLPLAVFQPASDLLK